jgi:hypothetical protein
MTTHDLPIIRVNLNAHAPERATFKARFLLLESNNWLFELEIGNFGNGIFIHPNDIHRFQQALQTALDQLDLPHGEPSAATFIAEAIKKDGSTDDGG